MDILHYGFMQRALIASVLVGLAAPSVGVYLVQRRLSLIGDGLGHVALAGVAAGVLTSTSPVWTALIAAVAGAVAIGTVIGVVASVAGVTTSFYQDTPSGGTIVLFAIALFVVVAAVSGLQERRRERAHRPA